MITGTSFGAGTGRRLAHVAAFLAEPRYLSLRPKSAAAEDLGFLGIVDANRAPENAELADLIEALNHPKAITIAQMTTVADGEFGMWIRDERTAVSSLTGWKNAAMCRSAMMSPKMAFG